jgi:hypothetical protein
MASRGSCQPAIKGVISQSKKTHERLASHYLMKRMEAKENATQQEQRGSVMEERVTYVVAGRILLDHVLDPGGPIGRSLAALAVLFCEATNANRHYGTECSSRGNSRQ